MKIHIQQKIDILQRMGFIVNHKDKIFLIFCDAYPGAKLSMSLETFVETPIDKFLSLVVKTVIRYGE